MWYLSFPFFCSNSSNSWWITKDLLFHSLEWSLIFLSVGFSIMAEKWLLAHSLIPKSFFLRKKKTFIPGPQSVWCIAGPSAQLPPVSPERMDFVCLVWLLFSLLAMHWSWMTWTTWTQYTVVFKPELPGLTWEACPSAPLWDPVPGSWLRAVRKPFLTSFRWYWLCWSGSHVKKLL